MANDPAPVAPLGEAATVSNTDALSAEQGISALEDLLSEGPVEEPITKEDEVQTDPDEPDAPSEPDETEQNAEEDADDENDPEGDEDPDEAEEEEDTESEAEAVSLDDETVIDFGDGTSAPLSELKDHYGQVQKRVADFHRDYSQKTEALSKDRKEVEVQGDRLINWATDIKRQRDLVHQIALQNLPEEPPAELAQHNPAEYTARKAHYDASVQQLQVFEQEIQQEQQQQHQQQVEQYQQTAKQAQERVMQIMPELKDPEKLQRFASDVNAVVAPVYGFDAQELHQSLDPRMAQISRDLIAYQKLLAAQPKAKAKLKGKPPVMRAGKSQSKAGKVASGAKKRADKLRTTGSLQAGIDALMDFDL